MAAARKPAEATADAELRSWRERKDEPKAEVVVSVCVVAIAVAVVVTVVVVMVIIVVVDAETEAMLSMGVTKDNSHLLINEMGVTDPKSTIDFVNTPSDIISVLTILSDLAILKASGESLFTEKFVPVASVSGGGIETPVVVASVEIMDSEDDMLFGMGLGSSPGRVFVRNSAATKDGVGFDRCCGRE